MATLCLVEIAHMPLIGGGLSGAHLEQETPEETRSGACTCDQLPAGKTTLVENTLVRTSGLHYNEPSIAQCIQAVAFN